MRINGHHLARRPADRRDAGGDPHPRPNGRGGGGVPAIDSPRAAGIGNLLGGGAHEAGADLRGPRGIAGEERAGAELVHEARNAAGAAMDLAKSLVAEQVTRLARGHGEAMPNVGAGLVITEMTEFLPLGTPVIITRNDA